MQIPQLHNQINVWKYLPMPLINSTNHTTGLHIKNKNAKTNRRRYNTRKTSYQKNKEKSKLVTILKEKQSILKFFATI